jgi:hypothetical protein
MHPRFTDNPPIDLEAMDPSVLRWFCHKWEERTNLARIVGYHNKNFREESEKLGGGAGEDRARTMVMQHCSFATSPIMPLLDRIYMEETYN